ncbi:hypothetical protein FSP39_017824 [Pinctada imbricata]|uniref:Carboxylic ester hydrolase n=1 Tax=Pinctada imbricata TaxID=66713 RepID=A0AA88YDR3_PINIB|nr:hypothetical protein FSP39_017824 [Pinctada imbricata]
MASMDKILPFKFRTFFVLILPFYVESEEVEIITSFGQMKGIITHNSDDQLIYQFKKIPYALPPVGNLRFQRPVTHGRLQGEYDATEFGPSCMQTIPNARKKYLQNSNVSEDCLHLNIYIPNNVGPNLKAVMVWIHGGAYIHGQGSRYDGSRLATIGNVVVVTVNYRLGLFGFLSTDDTFFPGNYGLWDQLEALKWIKEHIRSFGGDPDKITLFGESAGGYSVGLLSILPRSKGLFQRVICESGVALSLRAVTHQMKNKSLSALQDIGCLNESIALVTPDIVRCLQNDISSELLLNISNLIDDEKSTFDFYITYGPVVDGDLIPTDPRLLLKNTSSPSYQLLTSLDIMLGYNNVDGGFMLGSLTSLQKSFHYNISVGASKEVLCQGILPVVAKQYFSSNEKFTDIICGAYTDTESPEAQATSIIHFYGDLFFGLATKGILDLHSLTFKNTYQYLFSIQPSYRSYPRTPWFRGANHGDDVAFVFGVDTYATRNTTQGERDLSKQMMRYWTNFAKTGNPNGDGQSNDSIWPSYKDNRGYIDLNVSITSHHDLYNDRLIVWEKVVPAIGEKQSYKSDWIRNLSRFCRNILMC